MDTGLLVLRVVVGLLLVGHGTRSLFGWFGGRGLAGTARYFGSAGYWPPKFVTSFAITAEIVGGAALASGFMTPLAAAVVIGAMLNAVAIRWRNGLWAANNGFGYPLVIAIAAATLAFTGPGAASLDARVGLGSPSIEAGLFVVAMGLLAGSALLVSRAAARSEAGPACEAPNGEHSQPDEGSRSGKDGSCVSFFPIRLSPPSTSISPGRSEA